MADADPQRELVGEQAIAIEAAPVVEPTPRRKRRWLRMVLIGSVPLLIAAGALFVWLTSGRYVSTDNAYVQQDMVSVSPDVTGRIVKVNVHENQRVKRGDVLFQIDPAPYRIALDQADAAIAAARVDVSTMATDTGSAAADIESARADIELAQGNFGRQAALMKQGFTTRASYDASLHEVAAAKARLATAQASAAHARQQLGSGGTGSDVPATIQAAMAQREKAALDLSRTTVRAITDGVVSQTGRLQVGNVTPSGVPVLSLVVSRTPWVEANFKETDLNHMAVGQCVQLSFDAYRGAEVRGHVASIGAGTGSEFSILPAQNANGNWVKVTQRVPVRIAIDGNSGRPMIAGLSTDVKIDTQSHCG